MNKSIKGITGLGALLLVLASGNASAQSNDDWEYSLTIYAWLPDISGTTTFGPGGGSDFTIPIGDILDNLDFTAQGAFDVRKGDWGFVTDLIYMDLGNTKTNSRSGTIGGTPIPAEANATLNIDMKSLVLTGAAYHRFFEEGGNTADFLFGARYIDMEQSLRYNIMGEIGQLPLPGREGTVEANGDNIDFIIGLRGTAMVGESGKWFVPYYVDMGAGDSDFTWQAYLGVGYNFGWGQMGLTWRYLDYDASVGSPLANLDMSGPAISARWSW